MNYTKNSTDGDAVTLGAVFIGIAVSPRDDSKQHTLWVAAVTLGLLV